MNYASIRLAKPSLWWPGYHPGLGPKPRYLYTAAEGYTITREPGDCVYQLAHTREERDAEGRVTGSITERCEFPVAHVSEAYHAAERTQSGEQPKLAKAKKS
jgi:hypothetical protein